MKRLLSLALGLFLNSHVASAIPTSKVARQEDVTTCLVDAGVPHHELGTTSWNRDARPFNERIPYVPAAIAVPSTVAHIQDAVACGAAHGVKVSAKGGGHSYASFGLGGQDGHLVLEMDGMHAVAVQSGRARIQAGARLGHVAVELFAQGRRALPHGTCPGVGISGHALHGGYGMATHTRGLTLDWLVGATVVLANSTVVHTSATERPDLFWALRGGGSSFGIVTEFEFDTFAAPTNVTYYSVSVRWNQTTMVSGLAALQTFAETMPAELNMRAAVSGAGTSFEGVYYGTTAQLQTVLQPLLNATSGRISSSRTVGWVQGLEHYAYGTSLNQTESYNMHETFYASSLTSAALNTTQLESFAAFVYGGANSGPAFSTWWLQIDLHGGANSALSRISTTSTAYAHRTSLLLFQFYHRAFGGTYPEGGFGIVQGFRNSITQNLANGTWGMYANYADTALDSATAQRRYWGTNLERLRAIKRSLDPTEVFWNPQSISPAV
ncbi:hypothetical protein S40285_07641 [Stachybotrys chlorohalonatus IBT 40285]|uniref:FAD-binding PCMH-type domain-containing protein n=1 Tax=Stachybotrys chlorohalonatus (strain IBT 40285) TaxID=1283841 RepID=A0A084QH69_STAC4|nr:hypothetical protein S40285_07641 [Stachybotrys chlorohalonata IBT 40285]